MKQLLDLYRTILATGQRESNRTGMDTLTLPGAMLKFDLRDGFPAVTTKQLFFKGVKGELLAFLEGTSSLARFKELGCNVWDANVAAPAWQNNPACEGPDDMGRIYGAQWRKYRGGVHGARHTIDQIANALSEVRNNPQSRRIIVNAWNPAEINDACLPPCHTGFQLLPRGDGTLHMTFNLRSCDMFLGAPFNIASYATLLALFSMWTGRVAATMSMFISDAHIYVDHIDQVKEQLTREPLIAPVLTMRVPRGVSSMPLDEILEHLTPDDLSLDEYHHHPAIAGKMAV